MFLKPRRVWTCLTIAPFLTVALFLTASSASSARQSTADRIVYPQTKKGDVSDDYHGTKIADPYRWLEDLDSAETKAWVEAQNAITFGFLKSIPARGKIAARLTKLWDYEKFGTPEEEGGRYFYSHNDGLQNQNVLLVADKLDAKPRVLLDPNAWSKDGTVALSGTSVTEDGKKMAYSVSAAGSDWQELKLIDVDNGQELPDQIKWVKFSGASWTKDGGGFYYSRYDEPAGGAAAKLEDVNYFQKLYFHKLGTPQSDDKLIYHRPDHKEWGFGGGVTEDGAYLIVSIWQGTERKNRVYYQGTGSDGGEIKPLLDDFDAQYGFVGNDGPVFWFLTDLDAPMQRLIAIDTRSPQRENWKTIVPESAEALRGVSLVNNQFIASYLKDAHSRVRIFDTAGQHVRDVDLPGLGTAGGFGGRRDDSETFYWYTSFNQPVTAYRYDLKSGTSSVFKKPQVDFNPDDYVTQQVFYASKDGTKVPMFITHKTGVKLDGGNPTYLYGYGGFDVPITPGFSVSNLVWMEMGGVYAQANLRGGGEYGKTWHNAGKLDKKQNVFDDFIAAAEWLIANKYTRSDKLAIGGGSNGGLLVGACLTQRPDLFGAALPAVGVLDMLRFHKFTIGWAWTSDYGSSENPEQFKTLLAYSPLHNLKPGTRYPATMITTADHDDRVVPSHSFKFASALQAAHAGDAPALIRIETRAGHGAGKPTTKIIEEQADRWAFLVRVLGLEKSVRIPEN